MATVGDLLELLHGADNSFETVVATYRIWQRSDQAPTPHRTSPADGSPRAPLAADQPTPPDGGALVRMWRSGRRVRVQHEAGRHDGSYGVRDGDLWWRWDPRVGAKSNATDPTVGSGTGDELATVFDPARVLACLRFRPTGEGMRAARPTITVEAVPRPPTRHDRYAFALGQLGADADRYMLDVDRERGTLLHVLALANGKPTRATTAIAIAFDETVDGNLFVFRPPLGEPVHPVLERPHRRRLPLREAQELAPFTLLVPTSVPTAWRMACTYLQPSRRPAASAAVVLDYRDDNHLESVQISESAAAGRDSVFDELIGTGGWRHVELEDGEISVTTAGDQSLAYLERSGTCVFLSSPNLTADQLATLAASLRPAASSWR
jgi:hypothetical protein